MLPAGCVINTINRGIPCSWSMASVNEQMYSRQVATLSLHVVSSSQWLVQAWTARWRSVYAGWCHDSLLKGQQGTAATPLTPQHCRRHHAATASSYRRLPKHACRQHVPRHCPARTWCTAAVRERRPGNHTSSSLRSPYHHVPVVFSVDAHSTTGRLSPLPWPCRHAENKTTTNWAAIKCKCVKIFLIFKLRGDDPGRGRRPSLLAPFNSWRLFTLAAQWRWRSGFPGFTEVSAQRDRSCHILKAYALKSKGKGYFIFIQSKNTRYRLFLRSNGGFCCRTLAPDSSLLESVRYINFVKRLPSPVQVLLLGQPGQSPLPLRLLVSSNTVIYAQCGLWMKSTEPEVRRQNYSRSASGNENSRFPFSPWEWNPMGMRMDVV